MQNLLAGYHLGKNSNIYKTKEQVNENFNNL
jgi:hypothetical protein